MVLPHIVSVLATGLLAGMLANIFNNGRGGLLGSLFVGLMGSIVGGYVADMAGLSIDGFWATLIVSTLGASLLLMVFSFFHPRTS